jgi:hypothetical protein
MAWAPDYISADDLKDFARIGDDVDDVQVALAVTAASRAVDDYTHRQFGVTAAAELRSYTARPDYRSGYWVLAVDDFMTTVGLVIEVDGEAVTTYRLGPKNAAQKGRPWTHIYFTAESEFWPTGAEDEVDVTVPWGWTTTPATVTEATLLQGSRFLIRRNAPFGVAGSPELGNEMRLLSKVDPDVAVMLNAYKRARRPG